MACFYGLLKKDGFSTDAMTSQLLAVGRLTASTLIDDQHVSVGVAKLSITPLDVAHAGKVVCAVAGRTYDRGPLAGELVDAYGRGDLGSVLRSVNGNFQVVLYDSERQRIVLASDRFGTRPLYWYLQEGVLIFSGEVKSILAAGEIRLSVSRPTFEQYMRLGYFLGDKTWFDEVRVLDPACVLTVDLTTGRAEKKSYWSYSDVLPSDMSFDSAIDRLSRLLKQAVARCVTGIGHLTVPASGGYDSRFLIAASHELCPNLDLHLYTFGQPGSPDVEIAAKVAELVGQRHRTLVIPSDDDLIATRCESVWWVDGMTSIEHLHGMDLGMRAYGEESTILHGTGGGEILGSVYHPVDDDWDRRPEARMMKAVYQGMEAHCDVESNRYDTPHFFPNVLDNAIRKFAFSNIQPGLHIHELATPFLDNDLIDFLLSIPDSYRRDYRLYEAALKKMYGKFYDGEIAIVSAGGRNGVTPVRKKGWLTRRVTCLRRSIVKRWNRLLGRPTSSKGRCAYFYDYPNYLQCHFNKVEAVLDNGDRKYLALMEEDLIGEWCKGNLASAREQVGPVFRIVTARLYLDRVAAFVRSVSATRSS